MSRPMSRAPIALAACAVTACATDPTAPTGALRPDAPSRFVSPNAYQGALIPMGFGAAINASGAVVGTALDGAVAYYKAGVVTRLQAPAGYELLAESVALSDNDQVAVTGVAPPSSSAFYYASPSSAPISITGSLRSEVEAMNEGGAVIGQFVTHGDDTHAFVWYPNQLVRDITPPNAADNIVMRDISSDGFIVGSLNFLLGGPSPDDVGPPTNYLWSPRSFTGVLMPWQYIVRQALPGGWVLAHYRNGEVVWSPYGVHPVGPAPGTMEVIHISDRGRFVGEYVDPATGKPRAWTSIGTGAPITLPIPAGATASTVMDVNACGTIVGSVILSTGRGQAFVWSRPQACDPVGTIAF